MSKMGAASVVEVAIAVPVVESSAATAAPSSSLLLINKTEMKFLENKSDHKFTADIDRLNESLYKINNFMKLTKDIDELKKENMVRQDIQRKLSLKEQWLKNNSTPPSPSAFHRLNSNSTPSGSMRSINSDVDEALPKVSTDTSDIAAKSQNLISSKLQNFVEPSSPTTTTIPSTNIEEKILNKQATPPPPDDVADELSFLDDLELTDHEIKALCTPARDISEIDQRRRAEKKRKDDLSKALHKIEAKSFSQTKNHIAAQMSGPKVSTTNRDLSKFFPKKEESATTANVNKSQKKLENVDLTKYFAPILPVQQQQRKAFAATSSFGPKATKTTPSIGRLKKTSNNFDIDQVDGAMDLKRPVKSLKQDTVSAACVAKKSKLLIDKTKKKRTIPSDVTTIDTLLSNDSIERSATRQFNCLFDEEKLDDSTEIDDIFNDVIKAIGIPDQPPTPLPAVVEKKMSGKSNHTNRYEQMNLQKYFPQPIPAAVVEVKETNLTYNKPAPKWMKKQVPTTDDEDLESFYQSKMSTSLLEQIRAIEAEIAAVEPLTILPDLDDVINNLTVDVHTNVATPDLSPAKPANKSTTKFTVDGGASKKTVEKNTIDSKLATPKQKKTIVVKKRVVKVVSAKKADQSKANDKPKPILNGHQLADEPKALQNSIHSVDEPSRLQCGVQTVDEPKALQKGLQQPTDEPHNDVQIYEIDEQKPTGLDPLTVVDVPKQQLIVVEPVPTDLSIRTSSVKVNRNSISYDLLEPAKPMKNSQVKPIKHIQLDDIGIDLNSNETFFIKNPPLQEASETSGTSVSKIVPIKPLRRNISNCSSKSSSSSPMATARESHELIELFHHSMPMTSASAESHVEPPLDDPAPPSPPRQKIQFKYKPLTSVGRHTILDYPLQPEITDAPFIPYPQNAVIEDEITTNYVDKEKSASSTTIVIADASPSRRYDPFVVEETTPVKPLRRHHHRENELATAALLERSQQIHNKKQEFMNEKLQSTNPYMKQMMAEESRENLNADEYKDYVLEFKPKEYKPNYKEYKPDYKSYSEYKPKIGRYDDVRQNDYGRQKIGTSSYAMPARLSKPDSILSGSSSRNEYDSSKKTIDDYRSSKGNYDLNRSNDSSAYYRSTPKAHTTLSYAAGDSARIRPSERIKPNYASESLSSALPPDSTNGHRFSTSHRKDSTSFNGNSSSKTNESNGKPSTSSRFMSGMFKRSPEAERKASKTANCNKDGCTIS